MAKTKKATSKKTSKGKLAKGLAKTVKFLETVADGTLASKKPAKAKKLTKKDLKAVDTIAKELKKMEPAAAAAVAVVAGVEPVVAVRDVVLLQQAPGATHTGVALGVKDAATSKEVVVARAARITRTTAAKMASDLVRYMRIDEKSPYGKRGKKAIVDLLERTKEAAKAEGKTMDQVVQPAALEFVEQKAAALATEVQ